MLKESFVLVLNPRAAVLSCYQARAMKPKRKQNKMKQNSTNERRGWVVVSQEAEGMVLSARGEWVNVEAVMGGFAAKQAPRQFTSRAKAAKKCAALVGAGSNMRPQAVRYAELY